MKRVVYFLLLVCATGCFGKKPVKTAHKGESIPAFSLFLADSSTYFNTANLPAGRPVVFFYFGPGCPYSRAQMDEIIKDMKEFKETQFVIFTTSPFDEMKWFYRNYHLDKYPNVIIGIDYTNFFIKYFDVKGVPFLAVYNGKRILKEAFAGQTPVKQLRSVAAG